jgi:hypothetical protein
MCTAALGTGIRAKVRGSVRTRTSYHSNDADPKKDLMECWECEPLSDEEKLDTTTEDKHLNWCERSMSLPHYSRSLAAEYPRANFV